MIRELMNRQSFKSNMKLYRWLDLLGLHIRTASKQGSVNQICKFYDP